VGVVGHGGGHVGMCEGGNVGVVGRSAMREGVQAEGGCAGVREGVRA